MLRLVVISACFFAGLVVGVLVYVGEQKHLDGRLAVERLAPTTPTNNQGCAFPDNEVNEANLLRFFAGVPCEELGGYLFTMGKPIGKRNKEPKGGGVIEETLL